jgi:cell division protein FtsQ
MSATARRRLVPRLRVPRLRRRVPRPGARGLAILVAVAAVLVGAFFWVRTSSLVSIQQVTVTGVSGPDASAIRSTLVQTAERMTTMDVDGHRLNAAVARYPVVRGLSLRTHFPHGLTIAVSEEIPVATLDAAGQQTTVSARGILLRDTHPVNALPTIAVAAAPSGDRVAGAARTEVALLAAAPYRLLAKLASAGYADGARGLEVTLRDGPTIFFGGETELAAKWRAAIAVLASSTSAGASYIDVSDPSRPAAGIGSDRNGAASATTPAQSSTTPEQ